MDTQKLRQRILDLAIRGKLVPQDPNDEPASVLLDRIRAEKERLIAEGKIKRPKAKKSTDKSHYQNFTPPFDIPESWQWCKLADCCHLSGRIGFRGYTKDDLVSKDEGAITLSPSNIVNGSMQYDTCTYISWYKYNESPEIQVKNNDILLVKTGSSYGKCALVNGLPKEATINPQFVVLKHITVRPEYLTYILQSDYAKECYEQFVIGTAIPTFTQEKLSNLAIPLPPIQEQNRIVACVQSYFKHLGTLDSSSKSLSKEISQVKAKILDLAMQGKLVPQNPADEPAADMIRRINPKAKIITDNPHSWNVPANWTVCNLGDTVKIRSAKRVMKSDWRTEGVPFYRTREIVKLSENGIVDNELFISYQLYEEYREKYGIPVAGDIMITAVGTIGKTYIVRHNDKFYYKDASVLCISPYPIISSDFLTYLFRSEYLKKQLMGNSKGTTVNTITIEKANSYTIALPPFNEQKRMVAKIEELYSVLDKIEASLRS